MSEVEDFIRVEAREYKKIRSKRRFYYSYVKEKWIVQYPTFSGYMIIWRDLNKEFNSKFEAIDYIHKIYADQNPLYTLVEPS